jgi:dTDP-4-dehydrorhamnose reductase
MAEKLITEIDPSSLILRIRLPISEIPHPRNLLNKLSGYNQLIDCQESMVVVEDMFPRMLELIRNNESGVYHLFNEGTMSPAEVGGLIGHEFTVFKKSDLDKEMDKQSRARRTSTILGTLYESLPPLRERLEKVVETWKQKNCQS